MHRHKMQKLALSAILMMVTATTALAGETIGWRGDGTGIYRDVDPPLHWGRASTAIAGLRFQAQPPKDQEASGRSMSDGVVREWLVLGPVPARPAGEKRALTDSLLAEDQSKLSPAAGMHMGSVSWKAVKTETSYIDCAREFDTYGKVPEAVAYAHTYLYSPEERSFIIRVMHTAALHVWLNGKLTHKPELTELNYTPQVVKLQRGWNRLLLRIAPQSVAEQTIVLPWFANVVLEASPEQAEYQQQGIAWTTLLPSAEDFGGPIAVGGKVFLQSGMGDLVCIDAASGKILWMRSNHYHDLATEEEKKAYPDIFREIAPLAVRLAEANNSFLSPTPPKIERVDGRDEYREKSELERKLDALMRKVDRKKYGLPRGQDVGYSGFTPASDGQRIYAWFATGVTCCYDLDGRCVWRRLDNEGSFFEHGYSSSPLLADGKLIVFMTKLLAFDAATGQRLWTTELAQEFGQRFHGTPAAARIGQTSVCILPTGHIIRLSDGNVLRERGPEFLGLGAEIPSPVVIGNTVYKLSSYNQFHAVTLPPGMSDPLQVNSVRGIKIDVSRYPTSYLTWHIASPLVHDGLAYCVNNTGVLTVVDLATMKVVYEKLLDLDQFQTAHEGPGRGIGISPTMAGGRIYFLGNTGSTIVIKPGRTFEQLAKNHIECVFYRYWGLRHERFITAPSFEGNRMFIRGERHLYCVGGKFIPSQ